jgi:hypothetical protein
MIRACLLVTALLFSAPAHALPCWMVRKAGAQYGKEAAVETWARSKGIPKRKSREPGDASKVLAPGFHDARLS